MAYWWTIILTLASIWKETEACGWKPPVYDELDQGTDNADFKNANISKPEYWHPDSGWSEKTKRWPYRAADYDKFIDDYKKKTKQKEKQAQDAAKKAAEDIGETYDPKDPNNLGPGGIFGPKGPFKPNGPFGPDGPGPHFPPGGSGGIGDQGYYGPYGKPKGVPGGAFGDEFPYGKGSKYPAAWGKIHISPIEGILNGVPDDVDMDWPSHWKHIGLPNKGDAPPPHAYIAQSHRKPRMCYLKPMVGKCDEEPARFRLRWGFNPFLADCEEFVWSGCGGNRNNFPTQFRCREACYNAPEAHCSHVGNFTDYMDWPELKKSLRTGKNKVTTEDSQSDTEIITENSLLTTTANTKIEKVTISAPGNTNYIVNVTNTYGGNETPKNNLIEEPVTEISIVNINRDLSNNHTKNNNVSKAFANVANFTSLLHQNDTKTDTNKIISIANRTLYTINNVTSAAAVNSISAKGYTDNKSSKITKIPDNNHTVITIKNITRVLTNNDTEINFNKITQMFSNSDTIGTNIPDYKHTRSTLNYITATPATDIIFSNINKAPTNYTVFTTLINFSNNDTEIISKKNIETPANINTAVITNNITSILFNNDTKMNSNKTNKIRSNGTTVTIVEVSDIPDYNHTRTNFNYITAISATNIILNNITKTRTNNDTVITTSNITRNIFNNDTEITANKNIEILNTAVTSHNITSILFNNDTEIKLNKEIKIPANNYTVIITNNITSFLLSNDSNISLNKNTKKEY